MSQFFSSLFNCFSKWRFELNPKKSEVVVFGTRYPPRDLKMKLGHHTLKQVGQYKYLGIELTRTLRWHVYTKRILEKARRNMTHVWAICNEFEKIQIEMGRKILRCKSTLTSEAVLGELGWEPMK